MPPRLSQSEPLPGDNDGADPPTSRRSRRSITRFHCLTAAVLICVLLLPAVGGCSADQEHGPIADTTMMQVLIDLHLLRARTVYRTRPALSDSFRHLRDSVLLRRGLSPSDLDDMMDVYARDPERYEEIYTAVVDSLNKLRLTLSRADRDSTLLDSLLGRPIRADTIP